MENEWAAWADHGMEVRYTTDLLPPGSARPDALDVSYEVVDPETGRVVYGNDMVFRNQSGQEFVRVATADIQGIINQ